MRRNVLAGVAIGLAGLGGFLVAPSVEATQTPTVTVVERQQAADGSESALYAEARELYGSEIYTDGCEADFVQVYVGLIRAEPADAETDEISAVASELAPGYAHLYDVSLESACE